MIIDMATARTDKARAAYTAALRDLQNARRVTWAAKRREAVAVARVVVARMVMSGEGLL